MCFCFFIHKCFYPLIYDPYSYPCIIPTPNLSDVSESDKLLQNTFSRFLPICAYWNEDNQFKVIIQHVETINDLLHKQSEKTAKMKAQIKVSKGDFHIKGEKIEQNI